MMKDYLKDADMDKLATVLEIKQAYKDGKYTLEEARALLKEKVKTLTPAEVALAEQELTKEEEDECRKEDIQKMLELFEGIMEVTRPKLKEDHPILRYFEENDEMRKHLLAVEDLVQYPIIKNQWFELYDKLREFRIHLSRKQNQLYPVLEKKGFTRPTTTMWTLDDFIRDEISELRALLEADKEEDFIKEQTTLVEDIRDLMTKEETVLYPTSLKLISDEEFEDMKSGDIEIGFAFGVGKGVDKEDSVNKSGSDKPVNEGFMGELASLLGKYGFASNSEELDVSTGKLTLNQINMIFKNLPLDISFVDENEIVKFYSDTDHRIFPRSRNVIGRDVKNCHPRKSVHIVEEIVDKFRKGEEDHVDFWINKPGVFIYIYYAAVRDEVGNFKGVLEIMQDCSRIRNLQGSRTLLNWDEGLKGDVVGEDSGQDEKTDNTNVSKIEKEVTDEVINNDGRIEVTPDTKLTALLAACPHLKEELPKINSKFKMLNSPLGRVMIPKATVRIMSERSEMDLDELIKAIKEVVEK
ncbi:MAG: DUF438 domain-containing protein [Catonella sp.]|uniref:DUF438 domain-containing protein n=1 Tax=Catonella sp. TaxID=2382125 RepID=UPI003FA05AE3